MTRLAPAIVTSIVFFVGAGRARGTEPAPPIRFRLTVEAPAGCLDRESFLARVLTRSKRIQEAQSDENAIALRVELRPVDDQVWGRLVIRASDGEVGRRELRGWDCVSVANGLALVAAVILDPSAAIASNAAAPIASNQSEPAAMPTGNPAPPSAATSHGFAAPPQAETTPPARSPPLSLSLGWALAAAAGLGPDPQIIPRAFLDVELPAPLAIASARLSVGRGFTSAVDTSNGTADITLTDVRLEPCLDVWSPASFRVRACGIAEADVLTGEGKNTLGARSETRAAFELGLGLRPTWIVRDSIAIGLLAGVAVPLTERHRFYFASPDETAYRLAAWSALGEVNVGVRFW
jgi:hypothetical protein